LTPPIAIATLIPVPPGKEKEVAWPTLEAGSFQPSERW